MSHRRVVELRWTSLAAGERCSRLGSVASSVLWINDPSGKRKTVGRSVEQKFEATWLRARSYLAVAARVFCG